MALRSFLYLHFLRRSGLRRLYSVSGSAAFEGGSPSSAGGVAAFVRVAAGLLAVGGSGLGLWLLPASAESSFGGSSSDPSLIECAEPAVTGKQPWFLLRDSFRRKVFFKYEKRLRLRSSPEKIFEYFASFKSPTGEMFMSAADLMRAVIPVFPPSESNTVRDGYLSGERKPGVLHCASSPLFLLFDTNNDGLISFPEYIFFVTLLSIPDSSFTVAFKMFDIDNDGEIDHEEFKKVMALMRSFNRQGACHRDGLRVGLKVRDTVDSAGIALEFNHYDVRSKGTISAKDFALSMVASADMNHINKLLDRVDVLGDSFYNKDMRITYEEFKAFADLRKRLLLLSFAISSFEKANGLLTKEDFRRAAFHVCGVSLSDNVVDIIFQVFDSNNDGSLSSEEFLGVMQRREIEIRQPTSMGIFKQSFTLP
ncbi:hypothetical protein HPP92_010854 [Vanilla planifolia]|uniref:EF-hand domain-containing protein n=1 Tax=Vanilla planifolia TaxID=51239 RepID=A0A835V1U1_VANPL|nr:hypothetical protein HPP92_010854 [Vanilla planifolia]